MLDYFLGVIISSVIVLLVELKWRFDRVNHRHYDLDRIRSRRNKIRQQFHVPLLIIGTLVNPFTMAQAKSFFLFIRTLLNW